MSIRMVMMRKTKIVLFSLTKWRGSSLGGSNIQRNYMMHIMQRV